MLIRDVVLPLELTNGNTGRGGTQYKSARFRREVENTLRRLGLAFEPFDFPVTVHVTRILKARQSLWDSSSIGRGNWKEIEDAMVALGWFHDDGPKWIHETRFFQDSTRRAEGPAIHVQIFKATE